MPSQSLDQGLALMTTCKSCGEAVILERRRKRSFVTTTRKASLGKRFSWCIQIGVLVLFNVLVGRVPLADRVTMSIPVYGLGWLISWLLRPVVTRLARLGYFAQQEAETVKCPQCHAHVSFSAPK